MKLIGIGTDIIETARFENKKIHNERFMASCFTADEQRYLSEAKKNSAESMAGLFAAKEAVVKAMGSGFAGFRPCSVEIVHNPQGKPSVLLHGEAEKIAAAAGIIVIELSISHCKTHAVAFAAATG